MTDVPDMSLLDEAIALAGLTSDDLIALGKLDRHPDKTNWVEEGGGLPKFIEDIADSIHRKRGKSISQAIQLAVAAVKRWARGGGNVNADTRAKAAEAVAAWEALKAKAHAKSAAKKLT